MADYDLEAERIKLATVLAIDVVMLPDLAPLHSSQIRTLRQGVSASIYQRHRANYARLAKLSKILPLSVAARLAEGSLGPVLAAGVTCELEPERAAKLSKKLSLGFLAELSIHLEPKRASAVLAAIPGEIVVGVGRELMRRKAYITLARFVASIPLSTLKQVVGAIDDDRVLQQIGLFIEERDRLDLVLGLLPPARRVGVLRAVDESRAWPQTLALLGYLSDRVKGFMGDAAASLGEEVFSTMLEVTRVHELWVELLSAIVYMQPENRQRVLGFRALHEPGTVEAFLEAVGRSEQWHLLTKTWQDAPREAGDLAFKILAKRPKLLRGLVVDAIRLGELETLGAALERVLPTTREEVHRCAKQFLQPEEFRRVQDLLAAPSAS